MIKKIDIRPKYKGIKKIIALNNLGQVNVICGKNSSGKSSILEAIVNSSIGKNIILVLDEDYDILKNTKELLATSTSLKNVTGIKNIIQKYYDNGNTLYLDYPNEERLKEKYAELNALYYNKIQYSIENLGKFIDSFEDIYKLNFFKKDLIPTSRMIEDTIPIPGNKYFANGEGIVRKVYINKNQLNNSKEYKRYQRIAKYFYDICGFSFDITRNSKDELVLNFSKDQENWHPSSDSGFGLSDIFIIVSFTILSNSNLIMIEEPENHLHPDFQRRLLKFLKDMTEKQFILSSHSSVFLDSSLVDSMYYAEYKDNLISVVNETNKATILKGLGYSIFDNLLSDMLILVEGPSDIPVLSTIFTWMDFYNSFSIQFWPVGGDIMNQRFQLERYAIENYFTIDAIRSIFGIQVPEDIMKITPRKKVEKQIGLNPKKKNWNIINSMTLDDIEGTDLFEYCSKIKTACERGDTQFLLE